MLTFEQYYSCLFGDLTEDELVREYGLRPGKRSGGVTSLRGLRQAPTPTGTTYYAPGADDHDGDCAEVIP